MLGMYVSVRACFISVRDYLKALFSLYWVWPIDRHTVESRYNAIQYNMILHTTLPWLRQKWEFKPTKDTPYLFSDVFGENRPRYNYTALYLERYSPDSGDTVVREIKNGANTSNIGRIKSQHLNVSRLVLQLSLSNPLKPRVKSRMKM